jgi:RNA polymerase sigma-70 factor (ECF subfamily)
MHCTAELDHAAASFHRMRPMLVRIAYQVLGNTGDAEDAVQDAWIRWQRSDRAAVRNPPAFLATITTRVALNIAGSAAHRHERPMSDWPREPVAEDSGPDGLAARDDAVRAAMHLVCERLTPTERAAYLLREAFDYPYDRVAGLCGISPANARQVVRRARMHLIAARRRTAGTAADGRLVRAFLVGARTGDVTHLEQLLVAGMAR